MLITLYIGWNLLENNITVNTKKHNYFFIPLDSEILPLGIIPKDIIQKEEKAIHMNMFIVAIIAGTLETVDIIYLVFTMIVWTHDIES